MKTVKKFLLPFAFGILLISLNSCVGNNADIKNQTHNNNIANSKHLNNPKINNNLLEPDSPIVVDDTDPKPKSEVQVNQKINVLFTGRIDPKSVNSDSIRIEKPDYPIHELYDFACKADAKKTNYDWCSFSIRGQHIVSQKITIDLTDKIKPMNASLAFTPFKLTLTLK